MKIQEKNGGLVIVDFNELEAYKIASKIESDGISFYTNLSSGIKNKKIQETVNSLIQEEREHLKFFQEKLSVKNQSVEDGFEDDDLLAYMDYGIFKPYQDVKQMKDLIYDTQKALNLGIMVEDKSIKFYQACQRSVDSADTKKELGNIIKEEEKHKANLEGLLNQL